MSAQKLFENITFAIVHLLIAVVGVSASTAASFYAAKPVLSLVLSPTTLSRDTPLVLPFFPFQLVAAFATSFFLALQGGWLGRFGRNRGARLVWIIPTLWFLAFFIIGWGPDRWQHFFWSDTFSSSKMQLVTTLPLLASVAYSLGNGVAAKTRVWRQQRHDNTEA